MDHDSRTMHCMEVWGGNQAVDSGVVMAGLDAWVYSQPYLDEAGGGDVYYVSSCATGRVTRLLVADVSGHGKAVAEVGGKLRELMRRYVNHINQSRFMLALNKEFTSISTEGGFATAVVATFFAPTRQLLIGNAGHPPALLYRAKKKQWSVISADDTDESRDSMTDMPLGIDEVSDYREHGLRLNVGDLVLCYSDSVMEAHGADGNMLGVSGLLKLVQTINTNAPERFIERLRQALKDLSSQNLQNDDATLLLFRPNGLAPRFPLHKRLAGELKLVGQVLLSVLPGHRPVPWPEMTIRSLGGAFVEPLNAERYDRTA